MLSSSQREALNADLPASAVRTRQGQGSEGDLSYVDGFYVYDAMNRIFGPGGWGTSDVEIVNVSTAIDDKGRTRVGYVVKVQLFVETGDEAGSYGPHWRTTDVGFGSGMDKFEPNAHEKAAKEAVTDAVKRCCRYLGRAMGLALYDKTQAHVNHGDGELVQAFEDAQTLEDFNAVLERARAVIDAMPAEAKARLVKARASAKGRLAA